MMLHPIRYIPMYSFVLKTTLPFLALAISTGSLSAADEGPLSDSDRQVLLERLKDLQEGAGGRAEKRAGSALTAFRAAAGSDDRAHELYVKCVEKVRFEDEKRSSQAFREWKRRHKDREDSPGFRRVLRHQLNWLLLTIEANSASDDEEGALSSRAISALDAILGDSELEPREFKMLEDDVTQTVFALAYGVGSEKKWPASPVKLKDVYENHILPPLAAKKEVAAFRTAWEKWIAQEARLQESKSRSPEKGERSAAFDRFLVEKRPQMMWDLEKAIFEIGDEKGAALSMLKHLELFTGHKNEVKWTKEFFEILNPKEEPTE